MHCAACLRVHRERYGGPVNVRKGEYEKIASYPFVAKVGISGNEGDTVFPQSGNPERPFLNIRLYNPSMFSMANIHVSEGRLPQKEGEVVLSRTALDDGGTIALWETPSRCRHSEDSSTISAAQTWYFHFWNFRSRPGRP